VERVELELPQGAYRLTLQDGFMLARSDAPDAGPVAAKLVSANPASVTITAGETTRVALRFELLGGDEGAAGAGTLQIGVEVSTSDGGSAASGCESGLRIAEVDYEQASTDDAEFVELLNGGVCPVPLAELSVELVNGGDGKVYGRYPLADVAPTLAVGERLVLGACEDKNYRTIVATAMANGHLVTAKSPMDVNLAKQLNILVHDMGLPMERIILDPTTGALGYGIEYGYSVMERLRLAALQGDGMTQQPMIVTPGEEAWRTKEARAAEGVPAAWGDWQARGVNWEAMTAAALIESGADIVVMRHPEAVKRVKQMIAALQRGA